MAELHDDNPASPSTWTVPDWATAEFAPGQSAPEVEVVIAAGNAEDADETAVGEAYEAWQEADDGLTVAAQMAPAPVTSQPASHSIRARIRATPIEEPVEAKSQGLFAAIVRLFRRDRS